MTKTFTPSPQQSRFFDWVTHGTGHCILEAVAGAGKTTTLLQGVKRMTGKVWLGVFNKKLADEIQTRLAGDDDPFGMNANAYASTFHSIGFQTIRRTNKVRVDNDKCRNIAKMLIETREGVDQLRNRRLRDATPVALRLLSLAKNRLLTVDSAASEWFDILDHHDIQMPGGVTPDLAVEFAMQILEESRNQRHLIDFDDMIYLPVIDNLKPVRYDWILIDEAQDTNPARRALAGKMLKPGGRLIAVGDPRQAIYGFTGADNDALDQIRREYNAITIPLSVTFRCPRAVVEHARSFGATLEAAPDADEGIVTDCDEVGMLATLREMSTAERANTALLCRVTKHLVRICFQLIREGIPARIEGRSIGEGLIKLATRWRIRDLAGLDERLEEYRVRETEKAMAKEDESWAERVNDQVDTLQLLIVLTCKNGGHRVDDLIQTITGMFEDDVASRDILTLCTSHRAKGLEWDTVYLLGRTRLMPSPWAQQPWMIEQEMNLIYVSITRALHKFVDVTLKD